MPTGTVATAAHKHAVDLIHYVTKPIIYTTLNYNIGMLPAGAAVLPSLSGILVTTAFAGGTPQTADMGIPSDPDDFATALVLTSKGFKVIDEFATMDDAFMAVDTMATLTLSAGATPSAGAGYAIIAYAIVNRSLG